MNEELCNSLGDIINDPRVPYDQFVQLTEMAGDDAIEALAICMRDGNKRLRDMASSHFFSIYTKDVMKISVIVVPIIIDAVSKEENPVAKGNMIAALGVLGDKRAYDTILAAVDDEFTLEYALEALGDLGDSRALPVLLSYLEHDDWDRRFSAAYGLSRLGHPAAIPALVKHLDDYSGDTRITISQMCIIALECIGTSEAIQALRDWEKEKGA